MAKEKSSGVVILRGQALQAAANGFIQTNILTGLSQSGNDALVVKQITIESPTFLRAAVGAFEVETAFSRASKAAMGVIYDDDYIYKDKFAVSADGVGSITQRGVLIYVPPFEIVLIEDTIYFNAKSLNCTLAGQFSFTIVAQPATVTSDEKVGLLLTRIN